MSEKEVNDSQKTVVAFIAGLLVGGLLVWVFSDTPAQAPSEMTEDVESGETVDVELEPTTNDDGGSDEAAAPTMPELVVGDAAVTLGDNTTGNLITL